MKLTRLEELINTNDIEAIKESLASNPAEVNELDSDRRTALMEAALCNKVRIARLLLDGGADPNIQDKGGYTALHFAAQSYSPEVIELLLSAGAEVDAMDEFGNTPLGKAVFESRGRGEIITKLLKAGADKHRKNNHGVLPLSLARTIANYNVIQYFPQKDRE